MIVNLLKKDSLVFITLPAKVKGQFWLIDKDGDGITRNLIGIESENGAWLLKSNKVAWIVDNNKKRVEKAVLSPMSFYNIEIVGETENVSIFAEVISEDRQRLSKITVLDPCDFSIGRAEHHNIAYDNNFVSESDSRGHAKLRFDGRTWFITDLNSTNGTYVNGVRAISQKLDFGDLIYIMGLKIVVGKSLFAINNPEGRVKVKSDSCMRFKAQTQNETSGTEELPADDYFYRSPRFKRDFEKAKITIDPPPALQKTDQIPLALMLGPSLTMGLASLSMGILTFSNIAASGGDFKQAMPALFMSVSMLLGTLLWPPLTKRHDKKVKAAAELKRQTEYLAYLDGVRDDIRRKCKEQSDILAENITTADDCIGRIFERKRTLWERILGQNDFLNLRLGRGTMPLNAEITYPDRRFTLERDGLTDALYSLGSEQKQLIDVPISVSLVENHISGIVGPRSLVLGLTRSLLSQTVALHSYDELKTVFIVDGGEIDEWAYAKRLPHSWDNEKTTRFFATNVDEVKELSGVLERNLLSVRSGAARDGVIYSPHYLIIAANKGLALKCDSLENLLSSRECLGFSIVTLYDEIQNIPKETQCVIDLNGNKARVYDKDDLSGKAQTFAPETAALAITNRVSKAVSNIALDIAEQHFALPNMITFLEMFNVSKIEHLNPLTRWKENNPSISLQTPIGIDVFGEPFILDLHENFHGPHGLVAGTTGSGKSELIMTYILSLAVNYRPDEVAFLLIDYKGGGLTGAFEFEHGGEVVKLPHLAGTITNLDGAAIKRAMVAIESEAKRRQGVFNDAKNTSGEVTMDIYKYQRLYREKAVTEAMPHLFIISDEFAELKSQQPEFMDKLISTARVGRSLGIHLILATQKPAGVVDDQIWSNSRFRVCLKVQEKSDSMDMLKRPDAAEITQTGRFYLQVGFNEIFALGQSAWSGAEYIPTETIEKKMDSSVIVVDSLGRVVREAKPAKKTDFGIKRPKQLVSLVRYISELAQEEDIPEYQLWKEPIPEFIYIDDLEKLYNHVPVPFAINPLIGELDDPYKQRQAPLTIPLSANGNCVVYGSAGNGKTIFLTTLIYSILKHHNADEVSIYALDFGAETLTAFEKAPQVAGVLLAHETERIENFFKMLLREYEARRKQFSPYGGDLQSYNKSSGQTMPNIVVLINNYAAFSEQFDKYEESFALLSRDGLKYGITFVVTATNTMAIRWRIQQNFKQIVTMQLNDESNYSVILGKTGGIIPSSYNGRGLIGLDRVYEFQTAYPTKDDDTFAFIRGFSSELNAKATCFSKPVPMMPARVTADTFKEKRISLHSMPVGVSKETLEPALYDFSSKAIHPILANEIAVFEQFAYALCGLLSSINNTVVFDAGLVFPHEIEPPFTYIKDGFDQILSGEFDDFVDRHDSYKRARRIGAPLPSFEPKTIVIIGVAKLLSSLAEQTAGNVKEMLKRAEASFGVCFILVESLQNFKNLWDHEWYKTHVPGIGGIWVGDGFAVQTIFDPAIKPYENLSSDYGYLYQRGRLVLTKLLSVDIHENGEDDDE